MAKTTKTTFDLLTSEEQEAIRFIAGNPIMKSAIRKFLTDHIIFMGVHQGKDDTMMLRNWVFGLDQTTGGTMTDDQFGRAVRVHTEALVHVEQAITAMEKYEPTTPAEPAKNPAI